MPLLTTKLHTEESSYLGIVPRSLGSGAPNCAAQRTANQPPALIGSF
jgi:hypothetical protein